VNQQEDIICSAIEQAGITAVQMHGDDEDPHVADLIVKCRAGVKIFPAISMRQPNPGGRAMRWNLNSIRAFLLDSGSSSKYGGTGQPFDWKASIPVTNQIKVLRNVVLAGGLTPRNVVDAINILQPWGVDVASGVEARPGKKDPEKVQAFLRVVREFDRKVS
jgi:phosphoribosylanthranilate isomerase